jgi:hypothetical protein
MAGGAGGKPAPWHELGRACGERPHRATVEAGSGDSAKARDVPDEAS